uniref:Uncharacterized protein n=1 Tax=Nelumbo nucifera TaxID=4432 RepID=A0A822XJY7_NELNU|nr:TPA_asm: hypothetical protein HUJ06_023327 [Nelumbo nucifera]
MRRASLHLMDMILMVPGSRIMANESDIWPSILDRFLTMLEHSGQL